MLTGAARRVWGRRGIKAIVRSMAEHKVHTVSILNDSLNSPIYYTGRIYSLTDVAQGQTDSDRIGDKCTGTSLELRYIIQCGVMTAPIASYEFFLRVIIFIWKDDNAPGVNDILATNFASPIIQSFPMLFPFNHDRKVKRKILYNKVHTLVFDKGAGDYGVSANPQPFTTVFIPLTKLGRLNVINYEGGTTDGINKIYIMLLSHLPPPPTGNANFVWSIYGVCRYNFIDM